MISEVNMYHSLSESAIAALIFLPFDTSDAIYVYISAILLFPAACHVSLRVFTILIPEEARSWNVDIT